MTLIRERELFQDGLDGLDGEGHHADRIDALGDEILDNRTCWAASACAGLCMKASCPVSAANRATPLFMSSNQAMPSTLPTVAIL